MIMRRYCSQGQEARGYMRVVNDLDSSIHAHKGVNSYPIISYKLPTKSPYSLSLK